MIELDARFIAHLGGGGTVVTATRRQARIIRRLHDQAQLAAGRTCWPSADVLPLDAWLAARWREATERDRHLPLLLSDSQATWLWRRAANDLVDPGLVAMPGLSASARHAWLQLGSHCADLSMLEGEVLTRDHQQFLAWARRVSTWLRDEGWIDPGRLATAVAEQAAGLEPGMPLLLAGFTRPLPAQRSLVASLDRAGWRVELAPASTERRAVSTFAAADPVEETDAWLAWAHKRLSADPASRLAVIVPDLQARRAWIERRLEAVLQPELALPASREHDRVFDLAGGESLGALGIGQAAMDCLLVSTGLVGFAAFSRLLRSRHILAGDPPDVRTRFDIGLRRQGTFAWPASMLARHAREYGCPVTADALERASRRLADGPRRRNADAWAGSFGEVLADWGWPGAGPLASDEFQAARAIRDCLAELAASARTAPALTRDEALAELARSLTAPFQPERGHASVWVFDALEPPGIGFDGLWVTGLTATRWPRPATPDPFLPLAVQKRLDMPGSSAEAGLVEAGLTMTAWQGSARETVFSWPLRVDDAASEPSRLLPANLPLLERDTPALVDAPHLANEQRLETLETDPTPLLTDRGQGGARILDLQAKCPFRAFAELRLAARPLEEPGPGVNARIRGNLLHAALETLWRGLGGSAALARLDDRDLEALVAHALDDALASQLPSGIGQQAAALEREWQRSAILNLLAIEKVREPFEVAGVEVKISRQFAGLDLELRVDRIDRVVEGALILDYKTGRAAISQWRGARPDAPQLPLYASLLDVDVAGIAFACAGAQSAAFRGLGTSADLLPGMDAPERFRLTDDGESGLGWPQILGRWAGWLEALARGHAQGVAHVDPRQPQTCRGCHLGTLCRVAADAGEAEEGESDD